MQNPIDTRTTNAMVNYRLDTLRADCEASRSIPAVDSDPGSQPGMAAVSRLRRSFGLTLIRLGSRLAGIRVQPRISNQF